MKRLFVCFVLLFALLSACFAQLDPTKEKAILDYRYKVHQLELYNMILPVVMTKPQLRQVLSVVEKCRDRSRKLLDATYKVVMQLEPSVDDTISKAEKGEVPSPDEITKLANANVVSSILDKSTAQENEDDIYEVVSKNLNQGQLKAMANSLNPKEFPELLKNPDQISQEDKVRIFIRAVFMDGVAYVLLSKMSL